MPKGKKIPKNKEPEKEETKEETEIIEGQSPEDIERAIDEINAKHAEFLHTLKVAKENLVVEAIEDSEEDIQKIYDEFMDARDTVLKDREKIRELTEELNNSSMIVRQHYARIYDALLKKSVKEEYIKDVIGSSSTEATQRASISSGGGGRKITRAKLNDGRVVTWTELLELHRLTHKAGQSAHREWESYKSSRPDLPDVEVVAV